MTGGLGFVGSHLADALLEEGCIVTLVDNLRSHTAPPEEYHGRCQVFTQSIEELVPGLESTAFAFDEIYHLASEGSESVVKLALRHKARLLVASTSEVLGQSGRLGENSPSARPDYAAARLTFEKSVLSKNDLMVNLVRPFDIAGPRQLPGGASVLPRLVTAALSGAPLTVFGDGLQKRAFTDVRDLVRGLIAVMRQPRTGLLLNLANPKNEISMLGLAEEVKRLARSPSPIVHLEPKDHSEESMVVDPALACLDWQPCISLKRTILDTLEYYRGRPDLLREDKLAGSGQRLAV